MALIKCGKVIKFIDSQHIFEIPNLGGGVMANLKAFFLVPVLLLSFFSSNVHAEMSSTNYRITSTVMSGGGGAMSSANFNIVFTAGQPGPPGSISSSDYQINSGFWYTLLLDSVGDVNGDGVVNLGDVIAALQVVTGQSPATIIKEADADGDGKIGLSEALHILRKLGGI